MSIQRSAAEPAPTMTPGLALVFAIAGGAAVGNLYWAQPLLEAMSRDLDTPLSRSSWLVTVVQLGYAFGVFLIVPLGDVVNRRRLVPLIMLLSVAALVASAVAPTFEVLLAVMVMLGFSTVTGQLLAPLAGDLSPPERRGEFVSTVTAGLLIGILASRTLAGVIAGLAGWRAIFILAAVVALILTAIIARRIPDEAPKAAMPYPALIRSVFTIIRREPTVRWTLVLAMLGFGAFTLFWTSLTFLLSAPPYSYSVTMIGMFGLAGLAGAIAARRTGLLHDRGHSVAATGAFWGLALFAWIVAALGAGSVAPIIISAVLIDIALQGLLILNQMRLFAVSGAERSRLNSAFITANFLGGAAGSAAAGSLWAAGDWTAIVVAGAAISTVSLVIWVLGRRGPLRTPDAQ
ncbi:MFS transporter [Sinorhizobium medicae]|uniref:MFS transporter n=1 Tax=Sinorhizobium medicae TaxID=110321 RepID=UPI000FD705A4|nr:MFS transporter [Sinorhizobium medicae]RVO72945.1 MFS transporter [Sinorhizobium medicae]